jgi:lysophospholipase L1-like esterase
VVAQGGQNTGGVVAQGGQNMGGVVAQGGSETGGVVAQGGSDTGGVVVIGGSSVAPGGSEAPGGSVSTGGSVPKGGTTTAGGSLAPGGSVVTGGSTSRGGTTAAGGSGGTIPISGGQTGSTGSGVCPAVGTPPTPDTTTRSKCTGSGSAGITCHFGGSIGNYDVSFNLGGTAAGQTIVQAEHLREMLSAPVTVAGTAVAPIATTAGQKALYSMTVNVRQPEGQPEWADHGASDGTPGLDMYFIGANPQLDSIAYTPTTTAVVMYILTDSTGCDQQGDSSGAGTAGWGQWLPQFFGYGLSVANYGNSGALSECSAATTPCRTDAPYFSFYDDPKMWGTVKPLIKAGDVVLIEFAHNDKNTPQAAFEKNLTTYITETRAKGAIPVLATPIPRNNWSGSSMSATFTNSVGVDLLASIKSVGAANNVPVIDINAKVVATFSAKGQATVSGYYADPTTHLSTVGANIVAQLVRDEIKRLNIFPLVCFLR